MYCWRLAWRILSITLLACEMSAIVQSFEHSLAWLFFGIGMKTDLFQSCGHCWVFQICWHFECSTFTESSFRIWNGSTGIPLPPLALFLVMLPKAYLTSHYRMSGSMLVIITPLWLSGSWRSFSYSPSVYSCHFLISSASVRSIPFLSFIEPTQGSVSYFSGRMHNKALVSHEDKYRWEKTKVKICITQHRASCSNCPLNVYCHIPHHPRIFEREKLKV